MFFMNDKILQNTEEMEMEREELEYSSKQDDALQPSKWSPEYSDLDKEHASLLQKLSVMCRSNKNTFTVSDRIRVIRELVKDTEYKETLLDNAPASIWSKIPIEELPENVILISTHSDIVPSISRCSSTLKEDGFYSGTYDNIGTNAAAVLLMLEHSLPDNVVIAFTGDEETGGCKGAKKTAEYLAGYGKNLTCIALDVTYEGFWENRLCSIENATAPEQESEFLNMIAETAVSTEGENQSFCFVKAGKKHVPGNLDEKYLSPSTGMYDEAFAYRDEGYKALSFCLPCEGYMHSNSGVLVKQPVFEGYVISLASFVYQLTHTHSQLIEAFKIAKDNLIASASQITYEAPKPVWSKSESIPTYIPVSSSYSYDDEYDEEDELPWHETDGLDLLIDDLTRKASWYEPGEEETFVHDMEIPQEYMKYFCTDPDSAILPSEELIMQQFVRDVFRQIHGTNKPIENASFHNSYEEDDYEDDDYIIMPSN